MKTGTLSLNINTHDFNYGAVLHSWAFLKVLDRIGCSDAEVIAYTTPHVGRTGLFGPIINAFCKLYLAGLLRAVASFPAYAVRYFRFRRFIKQHIKKSNKHYTQKSFKTRKLDYDLLIAESDVIWSIRFFKGIFDPSFFFAWDNMKDIKKIAYSPSIGDDVMNEREEEQLQRLIGSFDHISCRESYEKEILERLSGKPVTHVLDPVLLLEAEDYDEFCRQEVLKQPYLLLYLPVDDNRKLRMTAERFAKKRGLRIVEISTKLKRDKRNPSVDRFIGNGGIEEYLSAIRHAEAVFTNSFHAICFCFLFEKQFFAFTRKYAGKVVDICRQFGLENRFIGDSGADPEQIEEINFDQVNSLLKKKRAMSIDWLKHAVNAGFNTDI